MRDAASAAVVAVGLSSTTPAALRLAVDPARSHESGLAVFLADLAEDVVADGEAYVDGALLAAGVACSLTAAGTSTPTPGSALHRDLAGIATALPTGVTPVSSDGPTSRTGSPCSEQPSRRLHVHG